MQVRRFGKKRDTEQRESRGRERDGGPVRAAERRRRERDVGESETRQR